MGGAFPKRSDWSGGGALTSYPEHNLLQSRPEMNRIRIHVLPSSRNRVTQTPRPQEHQACSFTQRPCSQPRLEGLDFCIKHILEDKNAPYKQCSYVSAKNGKRCPNAAPKVERKDGVTFCAEHARRNAMALRAQMRKGSSGPSPETLLSQLSGYNRAEPHSSDGGHSEAARILDEDSFSEEEQGPLVLDQTWRGDPDSEADSIDSDHEDPLKHAGVYTAEEVALITREKLIRLQSLYIDQFKRLQHLLKEKKRRYLHNRKVEHETLGSSLLTGPEGLSMKEKDDLKKLKALRRYRRRYGVEALLHRQLRERRQSVTEGVTQPNTRTVSEKCIAFVEGARCTSACLPMARHCVSHIYQDSNQVLFKLCPGLKDAPCQRTVHMGQSDDPRCPLHLILPAPMFQPEQEAPPQEQFTPVSKDMYLSAAELQPTESLPLEFSDDLDVEGDGMQGPPSPLQFDTALALEDQTIRAIAEAPMDILTGEDLDASGQELSERDMDTIMDDQVVEDVQVAARSHMDAAATAGSLRDMAVARSLRDVDTDASGSLRDVDAARSLRDVDSNASGSLRDVDADAATDAAESHVDAAAAGSLGDVNAARSLWEMDAAAAAATGSLRNVDAAGSLRELYAAAAAARSHMDATATGLLQDEDAATVDASR